MSPAAAGLGRKSAAAPAGLGWKSSASPAGLGPKSSPPGRDGAERPRVVVVGGGLAGITAALACADAGAAVTLLEAGRRLGGVTSSVSRRGLILDPGQHVYLRCCSAYRAFLERIGSTSMTVLQDRLDIPVLRAGAPAVHLRRVGFPAPLHLAPTLAAYSLLSPGERLGAMRAAWQLRRMSPLDPSLHAVTFGSWLLAHGQSERAVRSLWDVFVLAALNVPAAEASLALALKVFQTGLLERADAADIGVHSRPLSDVLGGPSERALRAAGADVRLGAKARAVVLDERGDIAVMAGGEQVRADALILAVPHDRAGQLLPAQARSGYRFDELGWSAIVNAHVVLDRRVTDLPLAAAVGSPVQWLFDATEAAGLTRGQYLAVSISGADSIVDVPAERLQEQLLSSLGTLLPGFSDAVVERFMITRMRRAVFRQAPGSAARRPGPCTAVPNLFLAGAWTDTGWPATMEGAARSGMSAASHALAAVKMQTQSRRVPA